MWGRESGAGASADLSLGVAKRQVPEQAAWELPWAQKSIFKEKAEGNDKLSYTDSNLACCSVFKSTVIASGILE